MSRTVALAALAVLATLPLSSLGACGTTYSLPDRDTPVEVYVEAPAARTSPVDAALLVYVGDKKVVDGPIRLGAGETLRKIGSVYVRGGEQTVSVVLGGRAVATENVKIAHRAWIVIALSGGEAKISSVDREPGSAK